MGLTRFIKDTLCSLTVQTLNFDPSSPILLFGDPRGGTTWLTESLMQIPETAVIWEPLHLRYNNEVKEIGFTWRQYVPEDAEWPEARLAFERIFSGKILNSNTTFLNAPFDYVNAKRLIVKFCRGNALLPWVTRQFEFRVKPIYLVRHPFSVVASQLKQGGWEHSFAGFQIPQGRYASLYSDHKEFLLGIRNKAEGLLATWCITNQVPLNIPVQDRRWLTVHYESLLLNPLMELEMIFKDWDEDMPVDLSKQLRRTSKTAITEIGDSRNQLSKWQKQFNKEEIDRFLEILDYFGVTEYSDDLLPKK